MKVFELCICALACISLATCMSVMNKLTQQPEHERQMNINACLIEAGLNYDAFDVRDVINDDIDTPELEEIKQKHGCVIECALRQITWMEGSELKEEKIHADMHRAFAHHPLKIQVEKGVRDCIRKVKLATQERCERGVVAIKCGVKAVTEYFLPHLEIDVENR